jgi:hypothetical protein
MSHELLLPPDNTSVCEFSRSHKLGHVYHETRDVKVSRHIYDAMASARRADSTWNGKIPMCRSAAEQLLVVELTASSRLKFDIIHAFNRIRMKEAHEWHGLRHSTPDMGNLDIWSSHLASAMPLRPSRTSILEHAVCIKAVF